MAVLWLSGSGSVAGGLLAWVREYWSFWDTLP